MTLELDVNNEEHITNTIVVTSSNNEDDMADKKHIQVLNDWLGYTVLQQYNITNEKPLQLIVLRNFKRVLLITSNHDISKYIMTESRKKEPLIKSFKFNYSLTDTTSTAEKQYLQLPKGERLFLISPPTSPPPGFDYSRCEEEPNRHSLSKSHLQEQPHLYEIINDNGSNDSGNNLPREVTLLDNDMGKIVVNTCENLDIEDDESEANLIPTSMPPRSIFDDDEDLLTDVDE